MRKIKNLLIFLLVTQTTINLVTSSCSVYSVSNIVDEQPDEDTNSNNTNETRIVFYAEIEESLKKGTGVWNFKDCKQKDLLDLYYDEIADLQKKRYPVTITTSSDPKFNQKQIYTKGGLGLVSRFTVIPAVIMYPKPSEDEEALVARILDLRQRVISKAINPQQTFIHLEMTPSNFSSFSRRLEDKFRNDETRVHFLNATDIFQMIYQPRGEVKEITGRK